VRTALIILLVCAAVDLVFCLLLFFIVWVEHRRQRKSAAAAGVPIASARGQFGFLIACGVIGLVILYGTGWLLLRE
jgi:hypothetical protein